MRWPRGSDNHRQDASGDPDDSRHGSSSGRHPSQATWSWKVTDGFGGPPVSGLPPDGAVPRRAAPLPSRPWREGGSAPRSSQEHARCGRQPRQGTRPGHRGEVPGGGRRARAILRCRVDGHARVAGCVLNDLNDECLARWGPRPASSQDDQGLSERDADARSRQRSVACLDTALPVTEDLLTARELLAAFLNDLNNECLARWRYQGQSRQPNRSSEPYS
jgi:hypothetical protein